MTKAKDQKKSVALERKYTNHICKVVEIKKGMRTIKVFEKDILGYSKKSMRIGHKSEAIVEPNTNEGIVEFEITDRYFMGHRIFREQ